LLAESGVRLVGVSAAGNNQFTSFQPFLIIFILLVTAFAQVYCMNSALKFASAVTVVPVFFAYYSILGFFNSNIYFDHWSMYAALNYAMILSGIAVLVYGVYLVSASQAQQQQQATAGDTVVFITGNTNTAAASTRTGTTKVHPSVDHLSGDGDRKEISTAEIKVEDIEDGEKGELQQVVCVNSTAGGDIPLRELNN
jgi:hypothetical protein